MNDYVYPEMNSDREELEHMFLLFNFFMPKMRKDGQRWGVKNSEANILMTLYQMEKKKRDKHWSSIFVSKNTLAKAARTCRTSVTEFINSAVFSFFGTVEHRPGRTNIYQLNSLTIRCLHLLEVKGMFKFFRAQIDVWRRNFKKRFDAWLAPIMLAGHSIKNIFLNKLSTKTKLNPAGSPNLKTADPIIQRYSVPVSSMQPEGSRSNSESLSPTLKELLKLEETFYNDLQIDQGEFFKFCRHYSFSELKAAGRAAYEWIVNGKSARNPAAMVQHHLKRLRDKKEQIVPKSERLSSREVMDNLREMLLKSNYELEECELIWKHVQKSFEWITLHVKHPIVWLRDLLESGRLIKLARRHA